jgi:MFS transporter, AAHS family, 3-hydroxyphenylpropionic acid transporter
MRDENGAGGTKLALFLCFLAAFCEGIDIQAAGVAAGGIRQQFSPDTSALSLFFSASTFGLFIGAIIGGRLSDRFGRKAVLVGSVAAFGLFSLFNAVAWDMGTLTLARFLTGLGLGGALPNLVALGAEGAPPGRRSAHVTLIYSGTPLGGVLASLVSLVTTSAQWHWIFMVGGIVPLFVAPLLALFLREPPAVARAVSVVAQGAAKPGLLEFLGEGRAGRTVLLWVSFFLALLTLYLLLNWLPTLLGSTWHDGKKVAIAMIGFNVGGWLGALYIGFHLESQRRHVGVLLTFIGLPLLLLVLAFGPTQPAVMSLVVAVLGAAVLSAQSILYAYAPLCYPTRIRGTGVGFAVAMGRFGSIAGPLLGGALVGTGRSPGGVLAGIVPIVGVGGLCAIVLAWRAPPALQEP